MLQRSLTTAIRYAEELGFHAEIEVLDRVKLAIARRASEELELTRLAQRLDGMAAPPEEDD
jgi:hypothetical protein